MQELIKRAKELLADGTVVRVLGWKAGDLAFNPEPAYFETPESLEDFVYDGFCGANLSKYMIEASKLEGKTLVCLKPCDTYSFNQLIKEHRVDREKAYIIGVGCKGKLDIERIRKQGIKGIESISGAEITDEAETLTIQTIYGEKTCAYKDAMLERCHVCKGKEHKIYDELIGESKDTKDADRFAEVEKIEAMSPEEKFAFFQSQLSKCIRCNACRNVCPACSCRKCVFDSNKFDSAQKANVDSVEEKIIHIIRAFHVAGRCTDCGECSRVCPQHIPLHLLNRKFIKEMNECYGEYHVGAYAPVHHITIHIVKQIAILIAEDVYERLSGDFCLSVQCIGKNFIAPLPNHIGYKTQGIVPQCIHFYNVARTWNNRAAIGGRVHPGNRFLGAIGIQQSVFVQEEIVMPAFTDIVNNLLEKITVHLPAIFTRSLLGILL